MLGGMGALAGGALGSGLGSLAQGDDLGTAVGTGLLSYFGGKALGGMMGQGSADALTAASPVSVAGPADVASLAGSGFDPSLAQRGPLGTGGAMVDTTLGLQTGMGAPDLSAALPTTPTFTEALMTPTAIGAGLGAGLGVVLWQSRATSVLTLMTLCTKSKMPPIANKRSPDLYTGRVLTQSSPTSIRVVLPSSLSGRWRYEYGRRA